MSKAMRKTTGTRFRSIVKGRNLMTPTVRGYYRNNDHICELSEGTGFMGEKIFGVTVVNSKTMQPENDFSQVFDSLIQADSYMASLGDCQHLDFFEDQDGQRTCKACGLVTE